MAQGSSAEGVVSRRPVRWPLVAVAMLVVASFTASGARAGRVAVFEAAGPGAPPDSILTRVDAAVRRHLVLALPADGWSTLMAGPVAPGCTGRCAVDRAAEYGADLGLAVRVDLAAEPPEVALTVYGAPGGDVVAARTAVSRWPGVLVALAGRAAAEVAAVLSRRDGPVRATLADAAADSAAAAAERTRLRDSAGRNSAGMDLLLVEPGRPFIAAPEGQAYVQARPLPAPPRAYLLAATEVTRAQWRQVMGEERGDGGGDRRPVDSVTWLDAVAFCNRLSELEGRRPAYRINGGAATWDHSADGYRLPTDAEWEYACRAGTLTMFHGGGRIKDLERVAWFDRNSGGRTRDVGRRKPNAWGLYDMHGNVWEWVWDLYDTLPDFSPDNVESPGVGPDRTIRGGSWYSDPATCRTTNFCRIDPGFASNDLGFRVARTP
jgi:sulfatase modifying factor 1